MDDNNNYMYYYYNSIPSSTGSGMMMKKNNIPAFGNWDYVNDLPITQYFESASRQQGMGSGGPVISCSSSSSSSAVAAAADQYYRDNYLAANSSYNMGYAGNPGDHYLCGGVDFGRQYYPVTTAANFPPPPHRTTLRKPSTGPPARIKGARANHRVDKVPNLPDHFHFNNTTHIAHQPPHATNKLKMKKQQQLLLQNGEPHPPRSRGGVVVVTRPPKAVDEDLYKIPTELLHSTTTRSTHRKTKMGFVSRCLLPLCCVV